MQVNMLEAKSQLSKLVKAALAGEDVVIANNGEPAVKLVPVTPKKGKRIFGAWAHLLKEGETSDAAFTPELDAEIAAALYGDPDDPLFDLTIKPKRKANRKAAK
ncbi:MAG: type II toxin-antitoxin system prevent-host-death family antitoxin [Betaproteobacteria bacterium]|nr:type II toxin-antitoxin system prevent-host-death family antitoxin [Betaproteobacteria bacterium]